MDARNIGNASRGRFYQQEDAMTDLDQLRYPVGRFERLKAPLDRATRVTHIDTIEQTPATFRALTKGRTDGELETLYRPQGWTVRQVVHHVSDSHMNAYIRMKFAVTEDSPSIKAYDEAKWAELPEAKTGPIEMSLALLDALHRRWVTFLRALTDADFAKAYLHPELGRVPLDEALALYAWHCRHHGAHIRQGLGQK
jgi:DinB superfamily